MRRARIKVAPKLGPNLSRPTKSETNSANQESTEITSQESSKTDETTSSSNVEDTLPVTVEFSPSNKELEKNFSISDSPTKNASPHPVTTLPEIPAESISTPVLPTTNVTSSVDQPSPAIAEQHATVSEGRPKSRFLKARPNIEAIPHRVRTFSSASESEDEGRRLNRTRHHSLSSYSKNVLVAKPNKAETSDKSLAVDDQTDGGEKSQTKKEKREKTELQLRKQAIFKKLKTGTVDKAQLTMFDFIYYNPAGGQKKKDETKRRSSIVVEEANEIIEERLAEEADIMEIEQSSAEKENVEEAVEEAEEENEDHMPVPQVRVGADGQIILDEQSLVIETKEAKSRKATMQNAELVVESQPGLVNYGTWRKRKKSTRWSIKETARFYRALSMLGTDFSLMESLFPRRTRVELKKKFKLEEKVNHELVDRTIKNQKPFDPLLFGEESDTDAENEEEGSIKGRQTSAKKKPGKKVQNATRKRKSLSLSEDDVGTSKKSVDVE